MKLCKEILTENLKTLAGIRHKFWTLHFIIRICILNMVNIITTKRLLTTAIFLLLTLVVLSSDLVKTSL